MWWFLSALLFILFLFLIILYSFALLTPILGGGFIGGFLALLVGAAVCVGIFKVLGVG